MIACTAKEGTATGRAAMERHLDPEPERKEGRGQGVSTKITQKDGRQSNHPEDQILDVQDEQFDEKRIAMMSKAKIDRNVTHKDAASLTDDSPNGLQE